MIVVAWIGSKDVVVVAIGPEDWSLLLCSVVVLKDSGNPDLLKVLLVI